MSRPEVTLKNYPEVYDYYEQHTQSQVFARLGHAVLGKLYRPEITYAHDGAAEDAIRDEFRAGTRLAIASNHLTEDDQYVIVSAAQTEKVLHPLRGNTFIPTEVSLFKRPSKKGGWFLRRMVDELGAIPVYRKKDIEREGIEFTPEVEAQYHAAMIRADEVEVAKLVGGSNMAVFPEGTRNRSQHFRVQPLKMGFAHTVCKAAEQVPVSVVPFGIYYGGEPTDYDHPNPPAKYKPHVRIGMPIPVDNKTPEELVEVLRPAIQTCVSFTVRVSNNPHYY